MPTMIIEHKNSLKVKRIMSPQFQGILTGISRLVMRVKKKLHETPIKPIECDGCYWSSGSEVDVEPNYCYIARNDPLG